ASILQGVETNFEIDIFKPIIDKIIIFADKNKKSSLSDIYAVADHVRSAVFAVAEGILPSNEERGYVVRKVIRKAVWHGNKIGIKELFLYKLVAVVCSVMKNAYPELEKKKEAIVAVISSEEEKFSNTVESGLEKLNYLIKNLKKNHKKSVAGKDVFQLYDTFGFPHELTKKVAQENGLDIDQPGFQAALEEQRQRSKAASNIKGEVFSKDRAMLKNLKATGFIGYDRLKADSKIIAIFDPGLEKSLKKTDTGKAVIVTGQTPFYGKGGGQVADRGFVFFGRSEAEVYDVKMLDERVLHFIQAKKGSFSLGDKVTLVVDKENREDIARNHTATHLLQAALRVVLGNHIEQAGSYVGSDKLRFDFNHFKALTKNEIAKVEELVNGYIMANSKLNARITSYEQAKKDGALALFTEKYQDEVRVVNIASLSSELCAGSHVSSTGEIGFFKITAETSSSGGIRRIEAITGYKALKYVQEKESLLRHLLDSLVVDESGAVKKIEELMESQRIALAYKVKFAQQDIDAEAAKLISQSSMIKNTAFIAVKLDKDIDYISNLLDRIKVKSKSNSVIVLYSIEDKIQLVIGITADLIERGFDARNLIKKISGVIEGGGGGRADFVKAGGRNINGIEHAVDIIKKEIEALP
ncbi:MAG: alanine--tRNA ligase, partial [Candidatus Omnitrophica bacterium]|nr:alanine--tRNA ligase [Candidatus Omnitrophota bacterium]